MSRAQQDRDNECYTGRTAEEIRPAYQFVVFEVPICGPDVEIGGTQEKHYGPADHMGVNKPEVVDVLFCPAERHYRPGDHPPSDRTR